ncbi:PX domain-containing protein [Phytophthora infestans]|uniref:PX domain-containing protein n=1 Tax=Phytophthora infestans TaxID=4787 RepID=A0A833WHK2_PHYIN|nr:PX domain-containing protein [Phytophthora infestans]KAF4137972.1 PX domain-containing protein [Phytophthora infestans]
MTTTRTCSSRTEQQLVEATRRPRRGLVIDNFSRAPATGVWYYRVDVSVHEEELLSTLIDENESDDGDDNSSDAESVLDVEHYSILRRYNDFLKLYKQIRVVVAASEGVTNSLPPFPVKEYISPALVGLLWRVSSSKAVLKERRAKFEALLQWIENHPTARNCPAFVEFLGKPPQTRDGYVSLKEYTSPDWLSSLQQVTQGVEGRKRRYSADSSAIRSLLERSNSDASGIFGSSRRQRLQAVKETPSTRVLGKRRSRSVHQNRRLEPPCKKVALPAGAIDSLQLPNADQVPHAPQSCGKRKVAQVEGNSRKKQCVC